MQYKCIWLLFELVWFIIHSPSLGRPQNQNAGNNASGNKNEMIGLNELAKHVLKQICCQEWVHERCLRYPEVLCSEEVIRDALLSHQQVRFFFFYRNSEIFIIYFLRLK